MIVCPFCKKKFYLQTSFFSHVKMWHKAMMLSVCKCHQKECSRTFSHFYAYKRHLTLKHCVSFYQKEINSSDIDSLNSPDSPNSYNFLELKSLNGPNSVVTSSIIQSEQAGCSFDKPSVLNIEDFEFIMQQEISSFVSQLYSVSILPRSFVSNLINNLNNLYNQTLIPILQQKCNSTDPTQSLSDLTKMLTIMQHGFDNFKTEHHSLKYLENFGTLIKPQSVNISTSLSSRLVGGKREAVISNIEIQVISIKTVLKKLLELPNILSTILVHIEECKRSEVIVSNLQSELWKNIESKFEGKIVFPLLLYFDDVEINNPLGSHANIHKLGAVYFSLACIPYEYSSMLENIFLAQLHNSNDHKLIGNKKVFCNIIDQITDLSKNGLTVNVNGEEQTIYFSLLAIIGDNLGLNDICGFVTSFNSENWCRICTANKTETQSQIKENPHMLRTITNYIKHCKDYSTGVKAECIFNEIPNFHIIKNATVDIMHDIFEGICRYEIAKILNIFITKERYFSLEILNDRLRHIDCGRNF